MKVALKVCMAALLVLSIAQQGAARTENGRGAKTFELQRMQINNVDCPMTNYGAFGQSEARSAGCYWPRGSGNPYIFGAGIWIGAVVDGDTLVSAGYNTVGAGQDFCPGPPEHGHDHYVNNQSHPEDRLYFSTDAADLAEWPVTDSLGNPLSAVFRTADKWAHQEVWCEYHDSVPEFHIWASGTNPIGLHVRQISFAWNADLNENILFMLYEFENIRSDTLREMYVGHAADDDVGWADNDLLGCDIERSLGYCYTVVEEENWDPDISVPPYYVGKRFLQGPRADDTVYVSIGDPNDPGYPDTYMDTVYPGEPLPLTAFTRCTRAYDADEEWERYAMLAGQNITTREYDPWQGVVDYVPDDKRMVMGCGPFMMAPGEVDTVLFAVMFSSGDVGGLDYLKAQGDVALLMYQNGWAFPSAPPWPEISVIPGDQNVVISWDNSPELTPDDFAGVMSDAGDTLYRASDFEGYRLWRSRTALPDDWELLGEWDIQNDIEMLPGDTYVPGLGIIGSGETSDNAGLWYSYVDEDVINGISYYYAVTAFDYNTPGDPTNLNQDVWVSLESGLSEVVVTPRSEPGNLDPATGTTPVLDRGTTNVLEDLETEVVSSIAVTGDTYRMAFGGMTVGATGLPRYSYRVYNDTDSDWAIGTPIHIETQPTPTVLDTVTGDTVDLWAASFTTPVFDGIRFHGVITVNPDSLVLPDSVVVTTGDYDESALDVAGFFTPSGVETTFTSPESKQWAYRGGGETEIHWSRRNDTLTATLWHIADPSNPVEIIPDTTIGDGWCFGGSLPFPPFNRPKLRLTPSARSIWFYVSGVRYYFNGGSIMTSAQFATIDSGDVWTLYSSAPERVPCEGNELIVNTQTFDYASPTEAQLDRIKVVPNPYFVRADWDRSRDYRKVQFINLPGECTIRIYNLAGDLVRTLEHVPTSSDEGYEGNLGGTEDWDLLTTDEQLPASGIYIYHVSTDDGQEKVGKFAVIR